MKFYDLFCGIGGFRRGLELAGHQCVGSCEIEKHARQIYGKNFGAEPEHTDVTRLDAREVPDHDILCGGFPCQAFSLAGKRLGFADTRGTLFFEIARIAGQKRPRYLFLENVKGLLSHDNGRTFGTILATLDELGYDAEWQVINGRYFLPQNRERVFIIGHLRGEPFKQVFPLGAHDEAPAGGQVAAKAPIARTLTAGGHSGGLHSGMTVLAVQTANTKANGRRVKPEGEPMFTLPAQDKLGVSDGRVIRRLTPIECERLMGFPDGWTEGVSDTSRYRCLGNAVMPPVIEYIAKHLG